MNLKEGLRRIGLAAGSIGACIGLWASYVTAKDIHYQRERNSRFETLLNSPAVQRDVLLLTKGLRNAKDPTPAFKYAHNGQGWFEAVAAANGSLEGWLVNEDGVSRIYLDGRGNVIRIQDTEQNSFYPDPDPAPPPNILSYAIVLVFPIIGFLVPWGVLKGLSWIVAGFSHRPV